MNLFVLDENPIIAAVNHCDIHCNKMYLEVIQMLTNAFPNESFSDMPLTKNGTMRKYSHMNHPVSIWVRQCKENFMWTMLHVLGLETERLHRGMNPHFSTVQREWISNNQQYLNLPSKGELTPFATAISEDSICRQKIINFDKKSVIDQYRLYYVFDKPFVTWTNREIPSWFSEMKKLYNI